MADESVGERIGLGVAAAVGPLGPNPAGSPATWRVVVRKVPDLEPADLQSDPRIVVVSVLDDDAVPADFDNDFVGYRATVVFFEASRGLARDDATARRWRQRVRRRLAVPRLDGVPELTAAEVLRGAPFPRAGLAANLNATAVVVRYTAIEPRG